MLQSHQDSESKSKFIAFITNIQGDENLDKEQNNDIMEESEDEDESRSFHINNNETSWGYFNNLKAEFNDKTVQQVRKAIQKKLTQEDSQELNVAFLSCKLSTLLLNKNIFSKQIKFCLFNVLSFYKLGIYRFYI